MPIDCSRDEALRLFFKWRSESTPIWVTCVTGTTNPLPNTSLGVYVSMRGFVRDIESNGVARIAHGDDAEIVFDIREATFSYAEPSEAPAHIKRSVEVKFESYLEARLPDGTLCRFMALKKE